MISRYDYAIIGFYLLFMLGLGLFFRRRSKNTSDYFRAGGAMPWWITGVSAWIASFSAWTFTGAAGKIYTSGLLVLCLYWSVIIPIVIVLIYTSYRFRRMRVVSWMEAVRLRYGEASEQLYTWIKLPLILILSGVGLNAIGVFMSVIFSVNMAPTLLVLGVTVTVVAFAGGSFAVLASDFVQMLLVVTITLVAAFLALRQPEVGGLRGLIAKAPQSDFQLTDLTQAPILILWALSLFWLKVLEQNSMENSTMYLMVKNDRNARRMVLIPLVGTIIGPVIWIIPPMAASITHPHLATEAAYRSMTVPSEAAFLVTCRDVMPRGFIGLLICAMFGATLTSMDAGLNKLVGVFVRSFYLPIVEPKCPEKKLLKIGKACTLVFGAIIICMALLVNRYRHIGLFDLTNYLGAALSMPMAIPLVYGLFYRRTPGWSAWSTVGIGLLLSLGMKFVFSAEGLAHWAGWHMPLSKDETAYTELIATVVVDTAICSAWYFMTTMFYEGSASAEKR